VWLAQPSELPFVRYACCTKVFGSLPNFLPLLDGSDVCALSQELFPVAVEQSSPGVHGSLQAEVLFLAVIEPKVENLPPFRVDSGVAIFSQIQPNISFLQQA